MSKFAHVCIVVLLALCGCTALFAQSDAGTITGYVKDPSGAVVPGSKVVIKSETTGEDHTVTTDSQGHYTVTNLSPGLYTMSAEANGFKRFESKNNTLNSNSTIDIEAVLAVGQATETVEVSATALVLQTESGSVQQLVSGKQIQDQELNGRNPIYMAQMLPGVRAGGSMGDFNFGLSNGGYAVNGARSNDTQITVDGAPALRTRGNGTQIGVADVDATQEIQVLTADYQAEYGAASGGQIRIVTKGGGTDFHGALYEYFRNSALNANTWGRNLSTTTNFASPFRFNNFGFAVGGPMAIPKVYEKLRNKFFFFVAQDWIRYRYSDTQTEAVPTALMRTGNFSELLSANPWYKGSTQIYDPSTCPKVGAATCQPFLNNVIPSSKLSPNGLAILNAYPAATAGYLQGTQNWIAQAAHPINERKGTWNGDIVPNEKNHIEIRRADFAYFEYQPFDGGSGLTGKYFHRPNQTNALAWTYTISPSMVNEARSTLSVDDVYIPVNTALAGFNRSTLGINYPYLFGGKDIPGKIPTASLNDNFYSLAGGPYPSHSSGPIYTFSDSLTKIAGNHTLKFGFYYHYAGENDEDQINVSTVPGGSNNQNGNFVFTDGGTGKTSGASIANLALGVADSYTEIGPRAFTPWRGSMYEGFAQDSWKVTQKLHIDYGFRETLVQGFHSAWANVDYFNGGLYNPAQAVTVSKTTGNVLLGTGNPYNGVVIPGFSGFPSSANGRVLAASSSICDGASCNSLFNSSISKNYIKDDYAFQPRLGIAYQIDPKTVLRGGGGRFLTRMGLLDNVFPGGNSPFQPFVTVNNVSVDNPGASLTTGTAASLTITTLNPKLKAPEAWNWNVTFERQLPLNSILSVAYVAHRGLHAWAVYDINQAQAGTVVSGTSVNYVRPYKGFAAIQEEESNVNSMYNSLQVSWNRRFVHGSSFGLSYTLSKSSDGGSNYRDIVPDTYNTSNLWAPSEYDSRHIVVVNYLYDLPIFKDQTKLSGKLLGGWEIAGTAQFQTGTPCGVGTNNDFAGAGEVGSFGCGSEGQFWVEGSVPTNTAGFAGPVTNSSSPTYFSTTINGSPIFTKPASGTFNLQKGVRDSIYGPGFQDWNLSMYKKFVVKDATSFEFRAEAYDFINHPNWSGPNYNPTSSQFGMITGKTGLARNLQLSLRFAF
jgi:hypothetical protein